jgi:hypothetical protein
LPLPYHYSLRFFIFSSFFCFDWLIDCWT